MSGPGMLTKLLCTVLLIIVSVQGRVRRQGTREDHPVLPFAGQSRPGDESPSLEVQNENAEKGVIDNKYSDIEEVLESVGESDPGIDPQAELDQMENDDEPDMDDVLQGEPGLDQLRFVPPFVCNQNPTEDNATNSEETFVDTNVLEDSKREQTKRNKNTFWIIFGVSMGIMLMFLFIEIICKCRSQKLTQIE